MDLELQLAALIKISLMEDGERDVTSEALFDEEETREGVLVAKQDGVMCGMKFLEAIITAVDPDILVDPYLDEGDPIRERMMVLGIEGKVRSLLRAERIMMNFLGRLSGVATMTREFVDAVEGTGAVILDTRKTIPGWRYLDKYAVTIGGGINNRMNLEDQALLKDTHIDAVGDVGKAIEAFRKKDAETPLIVEVRDLKEFDKALEHVKTLTRILVDNFPFEMIEEAVERASGKILLEASGGIRLETARQYAETGVHFLSVGALTHSADNFDFSFRIS